YRQILRDQFRQKLLESYPTVNCDEVEYAFRKNTDVKDWGKKMNLALIDEVMIPYLAERSEASRMEETEAVKLMLPGIPCEEVSDEEIVQYSRDIFKSTNNWKFISVKCYAILKIELSPEEKEEIKLHAKHAVDEMFIEDRNLFRDISRSN